MHLPLKQKVCVFSIWLLLLCVTIVQAQVPAAPNPPRLVNDFAHILTEGQVNLLERTLRVFNDSTSNQIVVVTVNDLGGYDKAQFAYEIGEKWKVGQQRFDNGVVILIKPKTERERGEAFIATGYGLEGVLPDAICKRIVDEHMIPHFRENDYYGGIVAALEIIIPLAKGEYSEKLGRGNETGGIAGLIVVLLIFFLIVFLAKRKGPKNFNNRGGGSGDFWTGMILGNMLGSGGRNSSGSWGSFSGGSGGFGGFGGGSFGGGGAGGSW